MTMWGIRQYAGMCLLFWSVMWPQVTLAEDTLSVSTTIPITLLNKKPTCALRFNSNRTSLTIDLGTLYNGQIRHAPFTVDILCPASVKTAITAKNMNGKLMPGNEQLVMPVDGNTGATGPLLWLENNGKRVSLTGNEMYAFCIQTGITNRCSLSPVTEVKAADRRGQLNSVIRFDVVYLL